MATETGTKTKTKTTEEQKTDTTSKSIILQRIDEEKEKEGGKKTKSWLERHPILGA